jgi:hypothetical protein
MIEKQSEDRNKEGKEKETNTGKPRTTSLLISFHCLITK